MTVEDDKLRDHELYLPAREALAYVRGREGLPHPLGNGQVMGGRRDDA